MALAATSDQSLLQAVVPTEPAIVQLVLQQRLAHPQAVIAVPLMVRLLADQLTPVLAYRRLVNQDQREAPSFLFESVEGGERQGRHSILGAHPVVMVSATRTGSSAGAGSGDQSGIVHCSVHDPAGITRCVPRPAEAPLDLVRRISAGLVLARPDLPRDRSLPATFLGGWVGYAAYDSVRSIEAESLNHPPLDDRNLPELSFGLYDGVVVFDHVDKLVYVVQLALVKPDEDVPSAVQRAVQKLAQTCTDVQKHSRPLPSGVVASSVPKGQVHSNMTREQHAQMLDRAKEFIRAGDVFQVVLGQRFERHSIVDPFDVYRALRVVNPSPYMVYLQAAGCILVASSPEILCRVRAVGDQMQVTNRPLAGTRRRGSTQDEDLALERELLADPKERAEHIMLVDLGRNDVGKVSEPGTVDLPAVMEVERYSHVMHISSTVTGTLRHGQDCWDALGAALPVGTISGAPKVRAMQIIDELEPVRRGPYGGGMGYVGLDGQMDIALALRTIVVPLARRVGETWVYHLQASGGIVADSIAEDEYQETVNKAAALARAIDVAEVAFAVRNEG
jgi:anthranilate synthase component 1